jgi:hypothetical protein
MGTDHLHVVGFQMFFFLRFHIVFEIKIIGGNKYDKSYVHNQQWNKGGDPDWI